MGKKWVKKTFPHCIIMGADTYMYTSTCKISLDDHEEEKIAQVGKNLGGTPKTRGEN